MAKYIKDKKTTDAARIMIAIWIILIAVMVILAVAKAEREPTEVWVLCQPDSFVNVRMFPRKGSDEIGRLELGDSAWTDGNKKNGFLHITVSGFETDGWIYAGFVSRSPVNTGKISAKIVSRGRVRARRYVNGTKRKWLKNSHELCVYGYGDEWAVTSEGFIQIKFIEMEDNNGTDTI